MENNEGEIYAGVFIHQALLRRGGLLCVYHHSAKLVKCLSLNYGFPGCKVLNSFYVIIFF